VHELLDGWQVNNNNRLSFLKKNMPPLVCCKFNVHQAIFTTHRNARIATTVLAMAFLSVCPSVRLSHAGIVLK